MSAEPAAPTRIEQSVTENLSDDQINQMELAADFGEDWKARKTASVVDSIEGATGLRLNQGAQGIVGAAMGIIATLMIGVVILGNIDNFADFGANSSWNDTQQSVTEQSQQTFDFLNLVPFLLVALFILGLMAQRM